MPGFLPFGMYEIAIVREIWGVDRLGQYLAAGGVSAHVRIDDGPLEQLPKDLWLSDFARTWVEQGAMISPDGEHFPLLLRSEIADHPLTRLVAAYERQLAAQAGGAPAGRVPLPAKNKGGRPAKWDWEGAVLELVRLDALEGTANKEPHELIKHLRGWFIDQTGDSPANSALQARVSKYRAATD